MESSERHGKREQIGRACAVVHRNLEMARREGEVRPGTHPAILRLLLLGGLQMILQTQLRGVFRAPPEFGREGASRVVGVFLCGVGAK